MLVVPSTAEIEFEYFETGVGRPNWMDSQLDAAIRRREDAGWHLAWRRDYGFEVDLAFSRRKPPAGSQPLHIVERFGSREP